VKMWNIKTAQYLHIFSKIGYFNNSGTQPVELKTVTRIFKEASSKHTYKIYNNNFQYIVCCSLNITCQVYCVIIQPEIFTKIR